MNMTAHAIILIVIVNRRKLMSAISVRRLNEETIQLLRMQAINHGVSMEEEVRQIITRGVSTPEPLGTLAVKLFAPAYNMQDEFEIPQRNTYKPIEFK